LGNKEASEGIQKNNGSTFGGSEGGVRSIVGVALHMGNIGILFKNILINGHKKLMFLTLVPWKIFVITIIAKTLELAFNHLCPS
jgi:hypothetical protein